MLHAGKTLVPMILDDSPKKGAPECLQVQIQFIIPASDVPNDRKVSDINHVATIRPNKAEKYRVRLTAGGDNFEYSGIVATDTVSLSIAKIHLNSVISTPGAKYLSADIKYFSYSTPLLRFEYVRRGFNSIPEDIVTQYKLRKLGKDGFIYMEIRKGIRGLKQAGNNC